VRASCLESTWYSCSFLHPAIPCPFSCSHCLRSMSNPNPSIQGTKMVCATPVGSLKFDVGLGRGISEVALQGPSQLSAMTSIAQPQHDDTLPVTLFRKRRSRGSVAHCSRVLLLDRNKDRFSRTVWTRASSSTKSRDPKAWPLLHASHRSSSNSVPGPKWFAFYRFLCLASRSPTPTAINQRRLLRRYPFDGTQQFLVLSPVPSRFSSSWKPSPVVSCSGYSVARSLLPA
jgi:hypothetical protein